MIPLIMFLAGFYLGVLFYALLAVGRRGKIPALLILGGNKGPVRAPQKESTVVLGNWAAGPVKGP